MTRIDGRAQKERALDDELCAPRELSTLSCARSSASSLFQGHLAVAVVPGEHGAGLRAVNRSRANSCSFGNRYIARPPNESWSLGEIELDKAQDFRPLQRLDLGVDEDRTRQRR